MLQPTIDEKEQLISLVDELVACGFKKALLSGKDIWGHTQVGLDVWTKTHRETLRAAGCIIESGATRVVVVPEFSKWVLKFNYIGKYETDYNYLELEHFQQACDRHLEKYFAATYLLGNVDGLNVYMQEKVKIDEDLTSDSFIIYTMENYYSGVDCEDEEIYDKVCNESYELDNEERIYAMVDSRDAGVLIDFVYECDINDLHSGNWGYRGEDPVLIDYAGF